MRLLTLDDLCDYYSGHKNIVRYNAEKNNNAPVVVQLPGVMTFSESDYDPEMSLLKTHLKSCHIGTNRNHSNIEQSVMEEATPSIYNRPILGFIHKLSDDTYDFAGHEMFINDEGEIEYEEIPVGCIPESGNAHLVYDKDNDKTYLEVDGLIYEEYTRAADILKEKKESKVSVELALLDYSYNPKEKEMVINRFYFSGITILGKTRDTEEPIEEGMYGSKVTLKDFKKNNSFCSNYVNNETEELKEKMIEMRDSINVLLSRFNINQVEKSENSTIENQEEGGLQTLTKFEELLEKYNKTINDITFETDGLSDEELVSKFEEAFEEKASEDTDESEEETAEEVIVTEDSKKVDGGEVDEEDSDEEEDSEDEEDIDDSEDDSGETEDTGDTDEGDSEEESGSTGEETEDETDEGGSDDSGDDDSDDGDSDDGSFGLIERSFEVDGRKFSVSFELSHEDIRAGLYNLIAQYEEIDNDWYGIRAVYEDRFAFQGWFSGKIYGQKYTKDGDTVALDGERYSLHEELLTDSELAQLNEMRSNYSSIQTELNSYKEAESYADKMTVFDDEYYTQFLNTPEFKELMKKENVLKYSKEELEYKADIAFSKLVKKNKTFALDTNSEKKSKSTGGFPFGKIEKKSSFLDGLLNQNKTN